jgi:mRNA interferase HigB
MAACRAGRQTPTRGHKASGSFPYWEQFCSIFGNNGYIIPVNVISRRRLVDFWTTHPRAQAPLSAWYEVADHAAWRTPQDVKADFNSVDFVSDKRAIFDIGGNRYRLVVRISYEYQNMLVKFVGAHKEYDKIDPNTI